MRETIKARFVGGPWHNRVVEVSRLQVIYVAATYDPADFDRPLKPAPYSAYLLTKCYTLWPGGTDRTFFWQYVERDFVLEREFETGNDSKFPPLDRLIVRIFDSALRGCFYLLRGRHVDDCDDWPWPYDQFVR